MKDLEKYIASGVIEAYCLGNLSDMEAAEVSAAAAQSPEVQAEIEQTLAVLEKYQSTAAAPRPELKTRVLNFLDNFLASEKIDLQNPPLLNKYSDAAAWNVALTKVEADIHEEGFACKILKMSEKVELSVVWLSSEMVEDEHEADNFLESFLILEGACECNFDGVIVRFSAGDYFDIPPATKHTIRNISSDLPFVKGLVQRRKAA